jgi:hypothetical protein
MNVKVKKAAVILLLACFLLGVAGCAGKPQESAPPEETPAVTEPAAPAEHPSAGEQQEPVEETQPPDKPVTSPQVAQLNSSQPSGGKANGEQPDNGQVTAPQQPSLVLGRGHDKENNKITDPDTKFKAGEQFYFGFDNGVPFGVPSILLQYESAQSGEVLNKYSIAVDPNQSYNWAGISFKEPGQYKLVFMVNNTVRASQVFTIE